MTRYILAILLMPCAALAWHLEPLDVLVNDPSYQTSGIFDLQFDAQTGDAWASGVGRRTNADGDIWIRRTRDGALDHWETSLKTPVATSVYGSGAWGITLTHRGTALVAGRTEDPDKRSHWLVYRASGQSGATDWSLVDNFFPLPAPGDHWAYRIASHPSQDLSCVSGSVSDTTDFNTQTVNRFVVRCSRDDGRSWETSYEENSAMATGIAFDREGTIYVGGAALSGPDVYWMVNVSRDGGRSWMESDRVLATGRSGTVITLSATPSSGVMASGSLVFTHDPDPSERRWLVRASADQGASWRTIDDYQYPGSARSEAYRTVEDLAGSLFTVGYVVDAAGKYHWIVRAREAGEKTFRTIIDFTDAAGRAFGKGIAVSPRGEVLVSGYVPDSLGRSRWATYRVVRDARSP